MTEQRFAGVEVELPSVPRAMEDPAVAPVDVLAGRRRKRGASNPSRTHRRALVRAEVAVGDEAISEVEDPDLDPGDRDDAPLAGRKLLGSANPNALSTGAQPRAATNAGSTALAGRSYQSRAFVSKIRSAHSSLRGMNTGLSKSQ